MMAIPDVQRRNPAFRLRRIGGRFRPRRIAATWRWLAGIAGDVRRRRAEPRLTVAVDVDSLYEPLTGVGWYLDRLLHHLAGREDLRLRLYGQGLVEEGAKDIKDSRDGKDDRDARRPRTVVPLPEGPAIEQIAYRVPGDMALPDWLAARLLRALVPLLLAADGNRVLFAPNYLLPKRFRLARGAVVATVHDLAVRRLPWAVRPDSRLALEERLGHVLLEAGLLITPSAAVRDELVAGGAAPQRVRAIHHGLGQTADLGDPGPLPPGVPPRYGLSVGTLEPRKNVGALLAAWRLLRARSAAVPVLVLCGQYGWKTGEIRREVEAAAREGWLLHPGYVGARELAALYRGAAVVALPSLYEGFGLPVVEALWAGAPLVLSDIPVFHEVAGDAALYAPADRPDLWAERLAALLGDDALAAELRRRGAERARRFDWGRAAAETVRAWEAAAGTSA